MGTLFLKITTLVALMLGRASCTAHISITNAHVKMADHFHVITTLNERIIGSVLF